MTTLLALLVSSAWGADVDLFEPSSSMAVGDGSPQGEAPTIGEWGFSGGLLASYAKDPVVVRYEDGSSGPAVASLVPMTIETAWTVPDRLRIGLTVPVYAWVDAPLVDFAGGALGDVRLQANLPIWAAEGGEVAFGVVPRVTFGTGTADAAVAGGTGAELILALGGRLPHFGWLFDAQGSVSPNRPLTDPGVGLGSALGGTAAAWWQATEGLRLGVETDAALGLASGELGTNDVVGLHGFVQERLPTGIGLVAGVGTGLTDGIGSPSMRVFAGFHYTTVDRDLDRDGVFNVADACRTDAEDLDGFEDADGCPETDNDRDGIADGADLCETEREDVDGVEDNDGCPELDNDFDGVADTDDRCPTEPGARERQGCPDRDGDTISDAEDACPELAGPVDLQGCPDGDRDNDGVPDRRDRCPEEAGPPGEDPSTADGCPKTLFITGREIRITERIEFELGKAILREESIHVVDAVADVLLREPGLTRVEVQGHTDNVGSDATNLKLSQARADSVRDYLMARGVEPKRMSARGYGETMPLFSNRSETGREQNRRVQFVILEGEVAGATTVAAPAEGPTSHRAAPPAAPVAVAPATAPVPAPLPPGPPAPAGDGPPGLLDVRISTGVWATVSVDGQRLSRAAPFQGLSLASGPHRILVENPRLKLRYETDVTITTDHTTALVVPMPGESAPPPPVPTPTAAPPPTPAPEPAADPGAKPRRGDLKR